MPNYIVKQGTRVLTPREYKALKTEMNKRHQLIFDGLIFTGMRVAEFFRFLNHPEWYVPKRQCVDLPKGASLKEKAKQAERSVILSSWGAERMEQIVDAAKRGEVRPLSKMAWYLAVKRAGKKCLEKGTIPVEVSMEVDLDTLRPSCTRKTWTSWLVASYPDYISLVAHSNGHTSDIMLEHYLNPSFAEDDLAMIPMYTDGWNRMQARR